MPNADVDVEEGDLTYTVGGKGRQYGHYGKVWRFLKN
jgi:hypothetical protein